VAGEEWIGLAEAIAVLRAELIEAQRAGEDEPIRFELGVVDIDLAVVARRDASLKAGVRWVVTVGAQGSLSREESHRVTVRLQPRSVATGDPIEVSDHADAVPPR
jgi:hypothetical protein